MVSNPIVNEFDDCVEWPLRVAKRRPVGTGEILPFIAPFASIAISLFHHHESKGSTALAMLCKISYWGLYSPCLLPFTEGIPARPCSGLFFFSRGLGLRPNAGSGGV